MHKLSHTNMDTYISTKQISVNKIEVCLGKRIRFRTRLRRGENTSVICTSEGRACVRLSIGCGRKARAGKSPLYIPHGSAIAAAFQKSWD